MISIRVSESEYAAMRAIYASYGARNLADFARLAVQRAIAGLVVPESAVSTMIRKLEIRLNLLEERVSGLMGTSWAS